MSFLLKFEIVTTVCFFSFILFYDKKDLEMSQAKLGYQMWRLVFI